MNTEILRKEFEEILALEERARHFYDHYISRVDNEKIRHQLIAIRDDEIRHVKIAKMLVTFVS